MWRWLNDNAGSLSLILGILTIGWAVWRYLALKRQELRSERFTVYHTLIKQLVEQEEKDRPKMLDRQLAVVFELQRFPEYYEPSLRILKGLRELWGKVGQANDIQNRLLDEMDATIGKIEKKSNKWWHRISQSARGL
jgi:hypothetical protein